MRFGRCGRCGRRGRPRFGRRARRRRLRAQSGRRRHYGGARRADYRPARFGCRQRLGRRYARLAAADLPNAVADSAAQQHNGDNNTGCRGSPPAPARRGVLNTSSHRLSLRQGPPASPSAVEPFKHDTALQPPGLPIAARLSGAPRSCVKVSRPHPKGCSTWTASRLRMDVSPDRVRRYIYRQGCVMSFIHRQDLSGAVRRVLLGGPPGGISPSCEHPDFQHARQDDLEAVHAVQRSAHSSAASRRYDTPVKPT
jgi:hypothetical protein